LQKYVVYRKRKICRSQGFCRFISIDKKIQRREISLPASDQLNADATITLNGSRLDPGFLQNSDE
jgi:uroporphyrinogen-III synthase